MFIEQVSSLFKVKARGPLFKAKVYYTDTLQAGLSIIHCTERIKRQGSLSLTSYSGFSHLEQVLRGPMDLQMRGIHHPEGNVGDKSFIKSVSRSMNQ